MNTLSPSAKHACFITVEGIEGMGKTTAIKFIHNFLSQQGVQHILTREPGGTPVAEAIRQVLLNKHAETMAVETELLLMFASRKQHIEQVIKPALGRGEWVVCDRFTEASYAYQGGGRGIPKQHINYLEKWLLDGLQPDAVLLLDGPVEVGVSRMKNRTHKDRIESEEAAFFSRVRAAYLQRAAELPQCFKIIDANQSLGSVRNQLAMVLKQLIDQRSGTSV